MRISTDVFVIGGGPAGLAAAIAARARGFQVVVADGTRPPIDKPCGEGLLPDALAALLRLGVVLDKSDGFALRGVRFHDEVISVEASIPSGNGIGIRRTILHQRMVERAQDCGVSLLWDSPVTGLSSAGATVSGKQVSAHWIIGADGSRSRLRRWSGLDESARLDGRFAFRRHYHLKPWTDCVEVYWGKDSQAYVTPVGEEEVCVVIVSRRPNARVSDALQEFPKLECHVGSAEYASTERGALTAMHRLKRVYQGNLALIGDASGTVDAITGEGLCLSFHQAVALVNSFGAGELSGYQREHRRLMRWPMLMADFMLFLDRWPALRKRLLRALEMSPDLFGRMIAAHIGAASIRKLATTGALVGWQLLTA